MVIITSHAGPATMVMRNPGTHQVEINTAISVVRPKSELHGPGGAKRRIDFPARSLPGRNARWVTRIMIQMNGPPKKATEKTQWASRRPKSSPPGQAFHAYSIFRLTRERSHRTPAKKANVR